MLKRSFDFADAKNKIKDSKIAQTISADFDARLSSDGIDTSDEMVKSAKKMSYAAVISLALCIVFLLSMFIAFGKDVGFKNAYYFFREVNLMGEIGEGEAQKISYSLPSRNQSFAEFKRGFIVASDREIQVFNKAGYSTLLEQMSYSNPMIEASADTFLVYDLGGVGFTLYNSFEDIYLENREYPISTAAMSGDGKFAIVGKSARYNTEVIFYDDEGKREFAYRREDFAIDCEYSENGKYFSLLTLDASRGEYAYTLTILNAKNGEIISSITESGNLPFSCHYMSGEKIAVVCQDSVFVYNNHGEKIGGYDYPSGKLQGVAASEKNLALLFVDDGVNMKNTLYILDSRGNLLKECEISGEYYDMTISSRYVYFSADDGVYRVDISSLKLEFSPVFATDGKILVLDNGRVMLCRSNISYILDDWS